jgi:hypothetical protein
MSTEYSIPFDENTLLHIETSHASKLKSAFEVLSHIIVEGNIVCTPEGLRSIEDDHFKTIKAQLDLIHFERYYCKERIVLSLPFTPLFRILKGVNENQIVVFKFDEQSRLSSKPALTCFIIGKCVFRWKIPFIIGEDTERTEIPLHLYETKIYLLSSEFQDKMKQLEKNGALISFSSLIDPTTNTQALHLSCDGLECIGDCYIPCSDDFKYDNVLEKKRVVSGEVYKLKTLNKITKATTLSKYVEIYLSSQEKDLIVVYPVGSIGTLKFSISPSIEKASEDEKIKIEQQTFERLEHLKESEQEHHLLEEFFNKTKKRKTEKHDIKPKRGQKKNQKEESTGKKQKKIIVKTE